MAAAGRGGVIASRAADAAQQPGKKVLFAGVVATSCAYVGVTSDAMCRLRVASDPAILLQLAAGVPPTAWGKLWAALVVCGSVYLVAQHLVCQRESAPGVHKVRAQR